MTHVQVGVRADETAVLALAERAERVDQVAALDEATLLALRDGVDALHLTVRDGEGLVGYAQVRPDADGRVAELVVDPGHRRRGVGTRLLRTAGTVGGDGPLEVWAHGDLPAARALLAAAGAQPVRQMWVLGRDLAGLAAPATPPGVTLRPFRVGVDEAAWLAVNAQAFAHHPEQGRTTLADLLVREREPWFDAAGLILAVADDGAVLGSIWTKVEDPASGVGEVYVVGVDPSAQGMGLGRVLTAAGLDHLAGRGLTRVVLFVESDNTAALATYRATGFVRQAVHTRYLLPVDGRA